MTAAFNTGTLGLLFGLLAVTTAIWLTQVFYRWSSASKTRSSRDAFLHAVDRTWRPFLMEVGALTILTFFMWEIFLVRTVYYLRSGLRYEYTQEVQRNKFLLGELNAKSPYEESFKGSFAYTNTVGAFGYLVRDPRVQPNDHSECQLKITTTSDNRSVAISLQSIASAIGCNIIQSPPDPDIDAQAWREVNQSLPNFIVIHVAKENIRADGFVNGMSNTFHVQRSYDMPSGGPPNLVWLQIGSGSIWRLGK